MLRGLVGYTGFVGGNILSQMKFDSLYNSKNIDEIKGREFDLLIFSGAKAEKWIANQNPEQDAKHIDSLIENLKTVKAHHFVLISTVDVYKLPMGVNEDSATQYESNHAYGLNRGRLERFCEEHFKSCHILRLPGLFGKGIKKNVIFDFLNQNNIEKIESRGSFQFYNLQHICADINTVIEKNIKLLNLAVEPVTVSELVSVCFGKEFKNEILPSPASYDFRSKYDGLWNGKNGYLYSKQRCLEEMKAFVQSYKKG